MKNPVLFTTAALFAFAGVAAAQTPASKSLSTSLGVVVFPAKGQSTEKQSQDEGECFTWSKTQTGFDPMNPAASAPPPPPRRPPPPPPPGGQRVRGAARGAAAGAVIGEVANDDAEQGCGRRRGGRRHERRAAEAPAAGPRARAGRAAAAGGAQQQQAAINEQSNLFKKGFGACLESKGYTVK